jgi:hypothetical protein
VEGLGDGVALRIEYGRLERHEHTSRHQAATSWKTRSKI